MFSSCNGSTITSSKATIKYPRDDGYGNDEDCIWNIRADVPLHVEFISFDIEWEGNYTYDYVETNVSGKVRRYCGNELQQLINNYN